MSRIGKLPVAIPAGVKVTIDGASLKVEGPVGKLDWSVHPQVKAQLDEGGKSVVVTRADDTRQSKALHGLNRAVIQNMVLGVQKGYERKLEVVGVGYLAAIQKGVLQLRVGYANEVHLTIPADLEVKCPDQTHIVVKGADKQRVGQFAAEVRAARKPEPYKGKGVRYEGEQIRRKAGKTQSK